MKHFETFGVENIEESVEGGMIRPLKIGWRSIHRDIQLVQNHFRNLDDYKRWKESLEQAQRSTTRFETLTPSVEFFQTFYTFYAQQMEAIPGGRVALPDNWLDLHKEKKEETVAYAAYSGDTLVGGMLAFIDETIAALHVGFLAVDHEYRGVTAGLQHQLLQDLIKRKLSWLYYGKDTNLYGLALSPGLVFNKIRFGLEPFVPEGVQIVHSFFLTVPEKLPVLVYAYDQVKQQPYLYILAENSMLEYKQYRSSGIDRVEVHVAEEVIKEHTLLFNTLVSKS